MIVLDTHVLVWLDQGLPDLGPDCRASADRALADDALTVSAITFWEVAMLVARKRLVLELAVDEWRRDLLAAGLRELPVDGRIGVRAVSLSDLHRDPADRIIAATAEVHEASLATADRRLLDWPSEVPRLDARA